VRSFRNSEENSLIIFHANESCLPPVRFLHACYIYRLSHEVALLLVTSKFRRGAMPPRFEIRFLFLNISWQSAIAATVALSRDRNCGNLIAAWHTHTFQCIFIIVHTELSPIGSFLHLSSSAELLPLALRNYCEILATTRDFMSPVVSLTTFLLQHPPYIRQGQVNVPENCALIRIRKKIWQGNVIMKP